MDKKSKRIPLRELFINLSVIKEAFEGNDTVSEAIIQILDVLNEDSQNVFNLKLISGTRDNSVLTVIDTNYYNSSNDQFIGDKFKNIFEFKPYSRGSIVKEMSLTYQTPNNSLQTMLAIQNKSTNIPLFPTTQIEDQNQAMRIIYNILDNGYGSNFGIRHLPSPDVSSKNNEERSVGKFQNPNSSEDFLLEKKSPAESIIKDYKEVINASKKFKEGEGKELYNGLTDDYFRDEKPSKSTNPDEYSNTPDDIVYADALYAKDLEEYYEFLCRKNFLHKETSPPIPIELSLTTYGISGILPGDIFTVDYLPVQYKGKTFFQVMNVEHSVDSTGWKTTLQCQLRVRQTFIKTQSPNYVNPEIFLSINSTLLQRKISTDVKKSFKDFKFDEHYTTNDILVLRARGRLDKGKYRAQETMKTPGAGGAGF